MTKTIYVWDDEELTVFKKLWLNPKVSRENLHKVFHYRTWNSMKRKAQEEEYPTFNMVRKPKLDRDYLKELYRVIDLK